MNDCQYVDNLLTYYNDYKKYKYKNTKKCHSIELERELYNRV